MSNLETIIMKEAIKSKKIFFNGSRKYFLSSLIIPKSEHKKLTSIYNFCRLVDDLVDEPELHTISYYDFKALFYESYKNPDFTNKGLDSNYIKILLEFNEVAFEKEFELSWIEALFASMEMDLNGRTYNSIDETFEYTYGVAEVVGFMVSKAFGVNRAAFECAALAGRAAQWANFIRDIGEDYKLGRVYFPKDLLNQYNLILTPEYTEEHEENFNEFIQNEIARYEEMIEKSKEAYDMIPAFLRRSLVISNRLDKAVLDSIRKNPKIVFKTQLKPKKRDILKALISFS